MGPCDLAQALARLKPIVDSRLLVGPETLDDAAALKVSDDLAICFTADFITPLVDDPFDWGRIAAANSLSDIYAMGATPLAALNLVAWPSCLPADLLGEVLAGGQATAEQAGCLVVGGHTIDDPQPKYGMAVIGTAHPARLLRNRGARPGDRLYLTKPLGTGIVGTAIKAELAEPAEIVAAVESMTALNRAASVAAAAAPAGALTDVTGFGLIGHLSEMLGGEKRGTGSEPGEKRGTGTSPQPLVAAPSEHGSEPVPFFSPGRLGATIHVASLPLLPGAARHCAQGMIPAGAYRNRDAYRERVQIDAELVRDWEMLLYDPQTSGGLLAAIPPGAEERFVQQAAESGLRVCRIGEFDESGAIRVVA